MTRETSRDYAHPHRPLLVAAFDRVGRPRADLSPASLLAAARKAERLTDFGDPPPEPLLDRLCTSLEDEARLTPTGRWITRIRLVDQLRARLRLTARIDADPTLLDRPLAPPVVIVGLQRTGTTLLHRLLASVPGARAMASWEALNPTAFRRGADPAGRIRHARLGVTGLKWLAPDFFAVHPIDPLAPEEEVVLMAQSLLSTVDEATLRVPTWSAWLEQQDQTPAYAYLRRALRVLQADRPGQHWVLKTPHHLEWLDTLFAEFPDAKVVMTHRHPRRTQASFCSMVAHGMGLTSDQVDPQEIGQVWLRKCTRLLDRALASRDRAPDRFHDVSYTALMADPVAAARSIHAFAGLPFDPAAEAAVRAELASSPQQKHGRHVYDPADFGLTDAGIDAAYRSYVERFASLLG